MMAQPKTKTFGEVLRTERVARGATVANLAKHFSVSKNDIIAWEEGRSYPTDKTVIKRLVAWCPRLGVYRLELIHGTAPHQQSRKEQARQGAQAKLGEGAHVQFSTFGKALAWLRLQEKLSADDLARALGCPPKVIERYERDEPVYKKHLDILYESLPGLVDAPAPVVRLRDGSTTPTQVEAQPEAQPEAKSSVQAVAKSSVQAVTPSPFGESLRRLRKQASMTAEELGELIGVGGSAVRFWENGRTKPTSGRYEKLIELFPELGQAAPPEGLRKMASVGPKPKPVSEAVKEPDMTQAPAPNALMDWTRLLLEAKSDGLATHRVELLTTLKNDNLDLGQAVARIRDFAQLLETAQASGLTLDQLLMLLG